MYICTYKTDKIKRSNIFLLEKWRTYIGIINDLPVAAVQQRVADQDMLNAAIAETSRAILGQLAYDNQIDYLRQTRKPKKMNVEEWIYRIKNINNYIPAIDSGEMPMMDRQLVREGVMQNIPQAMKFNLRTHCGDTLTWDRVKEILTNIFTEMNIRTNQRNQRGKGNRNHNNRNG